MSMAVLLYITGILYLFKSLQMICMSNISHVQLSLATFDADPGMFL